MKENEKASQNRLGMPENSRAVLKENKSEEDS